MAYLQNEHSSQNMSESFSLENEAAEVPVVQTQPKSSNKNIVSSLTAAAANTAKNTWLNRKPSFKAAARSKRSISMTTMAAGGGFAVSGAPKSPQSHHRVSSVKSAKAAINRGGSGSSNLGITSSNNPRARSSNSFNAGEILPEAEAAAGDPGIIPPMAGGCVKNSSTNSSLCTTDPDITSSSIPALEVGDAGIIATFDLSYDDSIIDADEEDVDVDDYYAMDGGSEEEEGDGSVFSSQQLHHQSSTNVNDAEFKTDYEEKGASNTSSSSVIPKIMSPVADYESDEDLGTIKDAETKWAQEAFKHRRDKGRTDSTSTNEVTYINTILNKNRDMTKGEHIRKRILDESEQPCSTNSRMTSGSGHHHQVSDDNFSAPGSILDTPEPPILTIEPPSPMPGNMSTCTSPYRERLRTTSDDTDDTDHRYRTCTTSDEDVQDFETNNVMQPMGSSQTQNNPHPPNNNSSSGGSNIANNNKPKCARRKFAIRSSSARYNRKLSMTNTQTTVEFRAARNLNTLNPASQSSSSSCSNTRMLQRASSEPKRTSEVASQTSLLVADKCDSATAKTTKNINNNLNLETPDSLPSTNHPIPSYIHRSNEFISSTGGSRHASGEKESEGGYSPKGMHISTV